jgi:acylphosphatase
MKAVRLRITGRVQGVYYRASAEDEARRLGLVGWVRNEPDGAVAVLAQGDAAAVDTFIAWCRRGPPSARVAAVDVREEAAQPGLRGFRVE